MATDAASQLEAIREMMESGHRSVRMERHTLLLWGLAGAFLIAVTDFIFSQDRFDIWWQQAVASNLFITAVFLAVGFGDYRLTQRARARRGESLSFVQRQLTKVWWLFIGLIAVLQVGMNFFGGGLMFYPLVLTLLGLALYVHGLFSRQMLSWIGVFLIALGLGSLAIQPSFPMQKWLVASVLGLGFPLVAVVIDCASIQASYRRRAAFTLAWLLLVILVPATVLNFVLPSARPDLPEITLADYVADPAAFRDAVVRIPKGTSVPIEFPMDGGLLQSGPQPLIVELQRDIFVECKDGKPTGFYRLAGAKWKRARESIMTRVTFFKAELQSKNGPRLTMKTTVEPR